MMHEMALNGHIQHGAGMIMPVWIGLWHGLEDHVMR